MEGEKRVFGAFRKCLVGLLLSAAVVALGWWAVRWRFSRRARDVRSWVAPAPKRDDVSGGGALTITYPRDGTLFPPEVPAPTVRWEDTHPAANRWSVEVALADSAASPSPTADKQQCVVDDPEWTPTETQWEAVRRASVAEPAAVTIEGFDRSAEDRVLTRGRVRIATSTDEVGAPIFYREVNLPFSAAVRNPAERIRWRFGPVSSKEQPPIVLEKMPVCGNCHSFSADGATLCMDVDFASDKGSYTICPVSERMFLSPDNIITWSDFRKEDKKKTFGLLSQVSPDGRYVASTVKDLSVFLAIDDDLAFSQLFFPVQGILCYYDRQTETFHALPGADDPKYVQSNPAWSPDGRHLVFARSEAYHVPEARVHELGLSVPAEVPQFVSREETFRFDLYRIPFNEGRGGEPVPLEGASHNGKSNYFAKYSPDGRWIVFCRADSFMLLQPDSELYIIPAEGGEARRLECNTKRMNSWHSWSPNGKWLVFSSKAHTLYTQLMLTHIDEQGHTTPPIVLDRFTAPNMAANIPEFVNTRPQAIRRISYDAEFFADAVHLNAGDKYAAQGDFDRALTEFQKAVEANPDNPYGYRAWALVLSKQGKFGQAEAVLRKGRKVAPDDYYVNWHLGQVLRLQGKAAEAEQMYRRAIAAESAFAPPYLDLAALLLERGETRQGRGVLREVIRIRPDNPQPYCVLGDSLLKSGETDRAIALFSQALEKQADCFPALMRLAQLAAASPSSDPQDRAQAVQRATRACELTRYQRPDALITLADACAAAGKFGDAASAARQALEIARRLGSGELAEAARQRCRAYENRGQRRNGDLPHEASP